MALRFEFEMFGELQVNRTLERVALAAEDATPVWEALADRFVLLERRQFRTEGAAFSGGWAPLSPKYAAWKARHYPGKTILRRTDELWRSLTERPLDVEVILPKLMVLGSLVEYGKYHQQGRRGGSAVSRSAGAAATPGRSGSGNLPRRRPVELTDNERRNWIKIIQRFIVTGQAPTVGKRGGLS